MFDQPINGASFTQWVEELPRPTLGPGDIFVLDNFSRRKKPQSAPKALVCRPKCPFFGEDLMTS